jgi:hypothetical protein
MGKSLAEGLRRGLPCAAPTNKFGRRPSVFQWMPALSMLMAVLMCLPSLAPTPVGRR